MSETITTHPAGTSATGPEPIVNPGARVASGASPSGPQSRRHPMTSNEEMESRGGIHLASLGQIVRLFGRALRLHCPNCGGGPVLQHWLKLRVRCGTCGIRLERGEHDYFVGSLMFNYVITGTLLLVTLAVVLVAMWPDVPWTWFQYGGPVAMVAIPFAIFPFTKLLWLAFDLMLRPATPEELEWHQRSTTAWSTERDASRD